MPAPTRAKLYSKTGKVKTIQKVSSTHNSSNRNNASAANVFPSTSSGASSGSATPNANQIPGDTDANTQFEVELCWCIQTLENSLTSGKLSTKQVADTQKSINILKSKNQPSVKKRQLMRATFGDYRTKMLAEEKKLRLGQSKIHFVPTTPTKSYFVKKSAIASLGKEFKFNFAIDNLKINDDVTNGTDETATGDANKKSTNHFHVSPLVKSLLTSNNSFKFNFQIDETTEAKKD